ncbi:MlaD family protein [Pseudonocardia alni]|uniref:MlaD family protein n=1 Tax=Pseudonocardia alni TaxID=33907 RepID=UPI00340302BB
MRIPHTLLPALRLVTVVAFAALCAVIFGYLWVNSGGRIPLITQQSYEVKVPLADADNLVRLSDVKMQGVNVGRIKDVQVDGDRAVATMELDPVAAPLHDGASVTVRNKTLIEESYLDLADGSGAEVTDGSTLPDGSGRGSVQVDDVLASLDPETRNSLAGVLQKSGAATQGRRDDVGRTVGGLGDLGREGSTTLTALADQSDDLRSLVSSTTGVLQALDTRRGQIAQLVGDSRTVFQTVADNRTDVEGLVRRLPPVLNTARDASGSLKTLAGSLAPVAANLDEASPSLSAALQELPQTSADLRGLLPSLDTTLDRAPDTLQRVPRLADDVSELVPTLQVNLSDLNPALAFVEPYGRDIAGFFTNFSQTVGVSGDGNGTVFRTYFLFNEQTLNNPVPVDDVIPKGNAVPQPGTASEPSPGGPTGWQRLEEEPIPE